MILVVGSFGPRLPAHLGICTRGSMENDHYMHWVNVTIVKTNSTPQIKHTKLGRFRVADTKLSSPILSVPPLVLLLKICLVWLHVDRNAFAFSLDGYNHCFDPILSDFEHKEHCVDDTICLRYWLNCLNIHGEQLNSWYECAALW